MKHLTTTLDPRQKAEKRYIWQLQKVSGPSTREIQNQSRDKCTVPLTYHTLVFHKTSQPHSSWTYNMNNLHLCAIKPPQTAMIPAWNILVRLETTVCYKLQCCFCFFYCIYKGLIMESKILIFFYSLVCIRFVHLWILLLECLTFFGGGNFIIY